jgi:hypothetical protein
VTGSASGGASDFGYGHRTPEDTNNEFNVWSFLVKSFLARVRTAMPVQVISCTNSGGVSPFGFVNVQPLVNQIDGVGNSIPHAQIFQLPYFRLQGGYNAIICDPEKDDIGVAVFADRDITRVKNTQAQALPGSRRKHDFSDGMYFGGILNKVPKQYVEFITGTGITIKDINSNSVVMDTSGIKITDKNGNTIVMNSSGIHLN